MLTSRRSIRTSWPERRQDEEAQSSIQTEMRTMNRTMLPMMALAMFFCGVATGLAQDKPPVLQNHLLTKATLGVPVLLEPPLVLQVA